MTRSTDINGCSVFTDYLTQFITSNFEEGPTPSFTSSLTASEQLIGLTKGDCHFSSVHEGKTEENVVILRLTFTGIGQLEKELERLIDHDYDNLIAQGTWVATLKKALINLQDNFQVNN